MTAPIFGTVVAETYPLAVDGQARGPIAEKRNWRGERAAAAAVAPAVECQGTTGRCSVFVNNLDDADERRCSICNGRGTAQNFDSIDIVQIQVRERGIEGAAPRNSIHHQEKRVEFLKAPEVRDGAGWSRVSAGRDLNPDGGTQSGTQVASAASA